jgi:thiosulfate reductase cytochrome b subunit
VCADAPATEDPRHAVAVRLTHWLTTMAFVALLVSGIAILLAHPRLYWGETGALGGPSLVDLPLPLVLTGQTGWGRSLHFLAAWVLVLTGAVYLLAGARRHHFRNHLIPRRTELSSNALPDVGRHLRFAVSRPRSGGPDYNVLQKLAYSAVVFMLAPLMVWTGLAMSPAVTSVLPLLVESLSGQQSARTLHFVGAAALVLFLIVHATMVSLTGFRVRMRGMIIGR